MTVPETNLVGLISNKNSGHNREQFQQIQRLVADSTNIRHIVTNNSEDIPAALHRLAAEQIAVLAINGGDGTVSAVLGQALEQGIFKELPPVVVLPGGTANMTAGDIGARGKLLPAVRRFCNWAETRNPVGERAQRSMMRVQLGRQADAHYGMFLGMGAVIQGTEYAHREIHSRGLRDDFSGALGVARTVWGLFRGDPRFSQAVCVKLGLDNSAQDREYQAAIVAISCLQRLFLGMRPFWGTGPGPLRLSVITEQPHRFLGTFISIARGKPNRHATEENGYISHNAHEISINIEGSLNLDGEILTHQHFNETIRVSASPPITFIRL